VRKQPVTDQNVVAYVVMAEADNPQGKLLPGMTANADIIIDTRRNVLKAPAAALRWTPPGSEPAATRTAGGAPGFGPPGGGMPGGGFGQRAQAGQGGMGQRIVAQLDLDTRQQQAWEAIQAETRQKAVAARAAASGDRQAMREAMRKSMQEAFTRLEPSLRADQKTELAALRATMTQGGGRQGTTGGVVWVLRDGKPQPVPVRVGATDGSFTEISSNSLKEGDQVITGGGPKPKAKARSPFAGPAAGGAQTRTRL
jgi:HlyD family secretion protein